MHVVEDLITAFDQASDPRRVVAVEEHPEYPGTLVFQTLEGGLWPRYGEWMSRHLILNELFLLRPFVSLLEKDGWTVVFGPRSVPVLAALERWEAPLEIDGFTCPNGSALYPFQTFTLNRALERAEAPQAEDRLTYVGWGTGSGKAQPLTEPVLTPQGWRTMGDLRVGDHVIGSDGKPTRVVGVYPQGIRPVFRVEMNDGTFARCDEEHLWNVQKKGAQHRRPSPSSPTRRSRVTEGVWKTLNTSEIAKSTGRRWHLPPPPVVDFERQGDLPVDPYALGVFLGDGSWGTSPTVSTDRWIANHLGWSIHPAKEREGHPYHTRAGVPLEVGRAMTALGLKGLRSWEKFIPPQYLTASIDSRLSLLRGLMDTDGSASRGMEYSTTSPLLRDGVVDLVRSLGGRTKVNPGRRTRYPSPDGGKREGRESWRIHVNMPVCPFLLPRKRDVWRPPAKYRPLKTITGVVDEGVSEEQVCIMVDAPDNLYVTRGYNLTHNSLFATAGAQEMFNRDNVDVCLTFTLGPLRTNLYRTYLGTTELDVCVPEGAPAKRRRTYDERHQVYVLNYEKARVDFEALKALTAGRRTLYICDEANKLLFDDKPNQARQRFDDLVFGSDATVWPLSASVVAANALRYRDVFNLAGRIHRNPLGTKRDFIQRYTHRVRQFYASGIQVSDYDWNLDMLHDVRHRVSDRAQSVRKTDPGIRELFKGLQTVVIPVQLSVEDARLYRMVVDHARRNTDDDNLMHYYRLLRYVCNNPAALMRTADPVGAELAETHPGLVTARHSAKLESFIDLVESIRDAGDKTLVFTQWVEMSLDLIAAALDKAGIRYVAHHGGRSRKDNQQAQEDFKADPDITVFLSSDAGAYGLNMTEARYVIHYEAPYSWDVMMQRSNRIDRADSHLDGLTAYVFVTDDSVEERVWRICNERRELASATLGTTEAMSYSGRDSTELGNLSYLIFGEDAPVREKKNSARRNRRTA